MLNKIEHLEYIALKRMSKQFKIEPIDYMTIAESDEYVSLLGLNNNNIKEKEIK